VKRGFPRSLQFACTLFVLLLVPVYWVHYGPANFLWFSDIALFAVVLALWLEDRRLVSTMAVSTLVLEIAWNVGFLTLLLTGRDVVGLAGYMADASIPAYLRALSLFHVFLPPLMLWMLWRLGYDRGALGWATLLAWVVLPLTYLVSTPEENINWVYGPGEPQAAVHPLAWLAGLMAGLPLLVYLPTHWALGRLFAHRRHRGAAPRRRGAWGRY
jgi:hypothetical protein